MKNSTRSERVYIITFAIDEHSLCEPVLHSVQHDPSYYDIVRVKYRHVSDDNAHDATWIFDEHLSFSLTARGD